MLYKRPDEPDKEPREWTTEDTGLLLFFIIAILMASYIACELVYYQDTIQP